MTQVKAGFYVCGRCFGPGDEQFFLGSTTIQGICTRCGGLAAWLVENTINDPHLAVRGRSAAFSTCLAVEPFPSFIWDVNGYYAALGVSPWATRREIREAYQAKEGWTDVRLTHIVRQLLNEKIRADYDAVPLGSTFFDRFVEETVRREMEREAFNERAFDPDAETEPIDLDASLNKAFQVVDTASGREQYAETGWGYYLWASNCRDVERLARWRHYLAETIGREGRIIQIAVGFMSTPGCSVEEVDGQVVAFLGQDDDPSPTHAHAVLQRITA